MTEPSLKHALARWSGLSLRSRKSLEPVEIKRAAVAVVRILGDEQSRKPADYDLKKLYQRVAGAWKRYCIHFNDDQIGGETMGWAEFFEMEDRKAASRDLRKVPWILFYSPDSHSGTDGCLGADSRFVKHYGRWLHERMIARSIRMLIYEFLIVYPTELPTFESLRTLLQKSITGTRELDRVSLRKWQERCEQFGILNMDGNRLFIEYLISSDNDVQETLEGAGFEGRLANGNFIKSGILSSLQNAGVLLRKNRFSSNQLSRLLSILELDNELRFDTRRFRCTIAQSLLGPFLEQVCPDGARELLEPFFMQHFGDPRLPSGKPNWSGIEEQYRAVIKSWLARQALDAFIQLIKETAWDQHWSYRQAFWTAYFDHHTIRDAWFVLGPAAQLLYRNMSKKEKYPHGQLRRAQSSQSVLIMRMYGATIAEWSHSGSCRIWLEGNSSAPELYQEEYTRDELTQGADFTKPHYNSARGSWQDAIAKWLRYHTDVRISRNEYMGWERQSLQNPVTTPSPTITERPKEEERPTYTSLMGWRRFLGKR